MDDLVAAAEVRYSFAIVLKQCGQLATIFGTPASSSVATFCSA